MPDLPTDYVGSDDTEDVDHAGMHNDVNAAVNAINAELGANPSGASATVVARLDALDTTVAGKESSGAAAAAVATHEAALDPHTQYATDSALSSGLAGKADTGHGHAIADTTGLQTALDGKAATSHTHVAANVTDLGDAATKNTGTSAGTVAAGDHGHTAGDVSGLAAVATSGAYADLSGKPTLGTAAAADSGDFEAAGAVVTHTGDTSDAHDASAISVDASGFAGNLSGTDTDVQAALDTIDALSLGSGGGTEWLSGAGVPATGTGDAGEFYRNTSESDRWKGEEFYGPRAATASYSTTHRSRGRSNYVRLTTSAAHGLATGDLVDVSGVGGTGYNGTFVVVAVPSSTTLVYKTPTGSTESSSADTGGTVSKGWGKARQLRRVPPFASAEATYTGVSPGGWVTTLSYSPAASTVVGDPWTIIGTASFVVGYDPNSLTGASTSGEAYAFYCVGQIGGMSTFWGTTSCNAPTEAGGKAGLILGDGQTAQFGIEINLRNDNKLYIDQNFVGTVTNLWTSTTTASSGAISFHKRGGILEVVASSWGCDQRITLASSFVGASDHGVFVKNTTTGRVNVNSLYRVGA